MPEGAAAECKGALKDQATTGPITTAGFEEKNPTS
jgi:hypothetical protein